MPRPIWKGYITFGLVNIPVVLYSAEKKFDIQLKLIDSRDQSKIRYVRINENTGEEVPWNEVAKGYEYDDSHYVVLKKEDIKAFSGEHIKTIEIDCFVNKDSVSHIFFEKPYYLIPDKRGEKGYSILREALKNTKKIGICKVIIHTREYLAALMSVNQSLILNILRYDQELRKPTEFELSDIDLKKYKITSKETELAKQLISAMTAKWKPENYHDDFRETLNQYIEKKITEEQSGKRKRASKKKSETITSKNTNVINFFDLLKKSLKNNNHKKKSRKSRSK
jgi:DNA end-binding protein Ku